MTAKQAILSSHKERLADNPTISGICTNIVSHRKENKQVVFISAATILGADNHRLVLVQLKFFNKIWRKGRDWELSFTPSPFANHSYVNEDIVKRSIAVLKRGQPATVYFTLPHMDNLLPRYEGISFIPIEAEDNPTSNLLQKRITEETNAYKERKDRYL